MHHSLKMFGSTTLTAYVHKQNRFWFNQQLPENKWYCIFSLISTSQENRINFSSVFFHNRYTSFNNPSLPPPPETFCNYILHTEFPDYGKNTFSLAKLPNLSIKKKMCFSHDCILSER